MKTTVSKITQNRPFRCVIPKSVKSGLQQMAKQDGVQRGIFFDTSGRVQCERVNPAAKYNYLFKTLNQ